MATRFRNRIRWWDVLLGLACAGDPDLRHQRRRRFHRPRHDAEPDRRHSRRRSSSSCCSKPRAAPSAGSCRSISLAVHRLCVCSGRYLPPPWTHRGYDLGADRRASVHHARRHLRRAGRRVGDLDHPVHDLRRVPAALRRRQVLHRFLDDADGQQAERGGPHGGAVVVPARRTVGLGRRHHGDDRRGRLSDDEEGGLREERRRRAARGGRARRHHLAAGAGRGGLPDRRVSEDQLSRRDLDGDDPDHVSTICRCSSWSNSTPSASARTATPSCPSMSLWRADAPLLASTSSR